MSVALGLQNTYAEQLEGLYVPYRPPGFPDPRIVALNRPLVAELGLDPSVIEAHGAAIFSGSTVPADARPLAMAYAGHQFGGFVPQLGDGRAFLLGERLTADGRRFDLHLKGSGRTPFSRGGDGKAVLGPILREYLVGEAMHALGVPTTRVLAALTTGETVWRTGPLPGAVLVRVGASHLRVGTLQFFASRGADGEVDRLVDYALRRHFPDRADDENPALALLESVAAVQARLIARWMAVGFVHGVMNTDNFSLSGETLDFGPCAFMDRYDPDTVFSSIDHHGRYAYGRQPTIGQWNLARLAEALLEAIGPEPQAAVERAQAVLQVYGDAVREQILDERRAKLGLVGRAEGDAALVDDLLAWMQRDGRDHTQTFRRLASGLRSGALVEPGLGEWIARWRARLGGEPGAVVADRMDAINPVYIPRNHLVEAALEAAAGGDLGPFEALLERVTDPFVARVGHERYAEPAPADAAPYLTFCGT